MSFGVLHAFERIHHNYNLMLFSLLQTEPLGALVYILALVLAISVHEFSHALSAYLQGDHTAKQEGRLTINPVAHLDPVGSLMLLFVGFGWGRPVPFNPYNLKFPKWGPVLVGLAGPSANLIMFLISGIAYRVATSIYHLSETNLLIIFLVLLGMINIGLMFFNLIPVPPLDGAKLLEALVPDRFYEFKDNFLRYGPMILLGLLFLDIVFGVSVFSFLGHLTKTAFLIVFGN